MCRELEGAGKVMLVMVQVPYPVKADGTDVMDMVKLPTAPAVVKLYTCGPPSCLAGIADPMPELVHGIGISIVLV